MEAGLKLALPKAGLSGTISVFEQVRNNVPTADANNIGFNIQTGRQRARGVGADIVWEPTPAFSLLATYAHTDAKVTADNAIPIGDLLTRVPKDSGPYRRALPCAERTGQRPVVRRRCHCA